MADFTNSKNSLGDLLPLGAVDSSWNRVEPLITAAQLRTFHLGIPLLSGFVGISPFIKALTEITDDSLNEWIVKAVSIAELELGLDIFPVQHDEKYPFDKCEFAQLGYFQLRSRPINSIQSMTVTPADGTDIYNVPLEWIETAYMHRGQLNIIPLNIGTVGGLQPFVTNSGGGAFFLSILGQRSWIAAFWKIKYTTGWPDGKLPRVMNELIGTIAAIDILSLLASTFARFTSHSLAIDALSQSITTPGPLLFVQRIQELQLKKKTLINKLRALYGLGFMSNNV